MNLVRSFAIIGTLVFAAAAQERTFDGVSFKAPAGWQSEQGRDFVAFTQVDAAKGMFCRLAVYGMPRGGNIPAEEFARAWRGIILTAFPSITAPSPMSGRTGGGLEYLAGAALVPQGGKQLFANLFVFPGSPRLVSILVIVSSQAALQVYRASIESFLQSFRLAGSAPVPIQQVLAGAQSGSFGSGPISGVWMGFRNMPLLRDYEPRPRWITFFDDGEMFQAIPARGLRGFDRSAAKLDPDLKSYWGTYRYRDGAGEIEKPGAQYPTRIRLEKPGQIKLDDLYAYSKCANIDGLRLEGSWTSYANMEEAPWLRLPVGRRSVIRFDKDGRFTDEGIFAELLTFISDKAQNGAGSGTYEMQDFTLILRYADGRTKHVALTGLLSADPAIDAKMLYIGRALFRRMK